MTATVRHGDCREVMLDMLLDAEQFDACVTDPPYDLTSTVNRFGKPDAAPAKDPTFARMSRGFMGQTWDGTGVAFDPATWRAVYDVLKPGAHLAAFGGTRTFHRMAVAIEDAGFELRDCLCWLYGTGFPKSHDVSKGIDKALGAERPVIGEWHMPGRGSRSEQQKYGMTADSGQITAPATPEAAQWQGWGTALKPGWEPIILARKPIVGTVAGNVLAYGTGGINIDACRVPLAEDDKLQDGVQHKPHALDESGAWGFKAVDRAAGLGRWPANVLHDGSDEVEAAFAAFGSGDSGTASRFFYSAKAGKADRAGSKHPTVKPLALMRWLCTLITPPGGSTLLDPFAGSGSTLQAALECGFSAVGIEREAQYVADIENRLLAYYVA